MAKKAPEDDLDLNLLSSTKIGIFGLGLMGGSLAKALGGKCREIIAVDPDQSTLTYARSNSIVDHVTQVPDDKLDGTNLIILAAPIEQIIQVLGELPALHPGSPIVMDVGSTKVPIIETMKGLPDRFDPIGGHPMCGKEKSSIQYADRDLYKDAPFSLVPLERTSGQAKSLARQVVEAAGAIPLWLDAKTHDALTAMTSHLPYLISNNLAAITPLEAARLVGPGFRSTTRLAGSHIGMMMDIIKSNRLNLLQGVSDFQGNLQKIYACLEAEDYQSLQQILVDGENQYNNIITQSDSKAQMG